uniref:Uncharacterized protein n=1 Tax=Rhizophora mucronata TaxID=61149 RepID=A0A2P2QQX7_RHIMU
MKLHALGKWGMNHQQKV